MAAAIKLLLRISREAYNGASEDLLLELVSLLAADDSASASGSCAIVVSGNKQSISAAHNNRAEGLSDLVSHKLATASMVKPWVGFGGKPYHVECALPFIHIGIFIQNFNYAEL